LTSRHPRRDLLFPTPAEDATHEPPAFAPDHGRNLIPFVHSRSARSRRVCCCSCESRARIRSYHARTARSLRAITPGDHSGRSLRAITPRWGGGAGTRG
jgi:hypothetical protein